MQDFELEPLLVSLSDTYNHLRHLASADSPSADASTNASTNESSSGGGPAHAYYAASAVAGGGPGGHSRQGAQGQRALPTAFMDADCVDPEGSRVGGVQGRGRRVPYGRAASVPNNMPEGARDSCEP